MNKCIKYLVFSSLMVLPLVMGSLSAQSFSQKADEMREKVQSMTPEQRQELQSKVAQVKECLSTKSDAECQTLKDELQQVKERIQGMSSDEQE